MKYFALIPAIALLLLSLPAAAAETLDPEGYWLTENKRAVIYVHKCEDKLCGNVHWIIEGGMQYDENNPEHNLRTRPMCGLQIMYGLTQDEDDPEEWEDGKIYKADSGDLYDADIEVESETEMELEGYIGIPLFGKSQTWTRVNAEDYPPCTPPAKK